MKTNGNLLDRQGFRNALASVLAILIGMLVGLIILLISNPAKALPGFWAIATGGVANRKNMGQVLYYATPIVMTGLSVGFAKKTGLFNIGASGQYIMGAFAAVLVGVKCTFLPAGLQCLAAILAAALTGALWGCVPGLLKAYCNINEVIACIMMNYIGMSTANLLVRKFIFDRAKNQSLQPAASAVLPKLGFDKLFVDGGAPSSANAGFLVAVVLGVAVWVILEKTRLGFELKACGYNRDAAKYAGISDKKNILLAMVFAGGLRRDRRRPLLSLGRGFRHPRAGRAGRRGLQRHPRGPAGYVQPHCHHFYRYFHGLSDAGRPVHADVRLPHTDRGHHLLRHHLLCRLRPLLQPDH